MSAIPDTPLPRTLEDFLAWEALQHERHEFVGGEVFAMSGAKATHNTIALNVAMFLRQALRGTPCRTHIEGMKVLVEAADTVLYPDVFVTCDPVDLTSAAEVHKTAPRLVVEVLSESTGAYDRGLKFELYQRLPSLQEYLLVESERAHADLFRKGADGLWVLHPVDAAGTVELASLGLALPMAVVYEDVAPGGAAA